MNKNLVAEPKTNASNKKILIVVTLATSFAIFSGFKFWLEYERGAKLFQAQLLERQQAPLKRQQAQLLKRKQRQKTQLELKEVENLLSDHLLSEAVSQLPRNLGETDDVVLNRILIEISSQANDAPLSQHDVERLSNECLNREISCQGLFKQLHKSEFNKLVREHHNNIVMKTDARYSKAMRLIRQTEQAEMKSKERAQMCKDIGIIAGDTLNSRQQGESRNYLMRRAARTLPSKGSLLIVEGIIYEAFNLRIPRSSGEKENQIASFVDKWESSCENFYR